MSRACSDSQPNLAYPYSLFSLVHPLRRVVGFRFVVVACFAATPTYVVDAARPSTSASSILRLWGSVSCTVVVVVAPLILYMFTGWRSRQQHMGSRRAVAEFRLGSASGRCSCSARVASYQRHHWRWSAVPTIRLETINRCSLAAAAALGSSLRQAIPVSSWPYFDVVVIYTSSPLVARTAISKTLHDGNSHDFHRNR